MGKITIQKLIDYYAAELRRKNRYEFGELQGNEPNFPMLVVFAGKDTGRAFENVEKQIFETWPQFRDEIKYLNIESSGSGTQFFELMKKEEEIAKIPLERSALNAVVAPMFGVSSYFREKSRFFLYYVIETTSFCSLQDFIDSLQMLEDLKREITGEGMQIVEYLCILLNQNGSEREAIAKAVLNYLRKNSEALHSISIILSNHLSDFTILEDWSLCHRIIADLIMLTNNKDNNITIVCQEGNIYSPGYAIQEKPVQDIGQVIVSGLIERLSKFSFDTRSNILADEQLPRKLGVTQQGTIALLDEYVEQSMYKLLPRPEQLELFPRRESWPGYMNELSAYEFNMMTMNAWEAYLRQVVETAVSRISKDLKLKEHWKREYASYICQFFIAGDFIWMKEHPEEIKRVFSAKDVPSDGNILEAARNRLRNIVSSNPDFIQIFLTIIETMGKEAEMFLHGWKELYQSIKMLHAVRDENLIRFYQKKLQDYLDSRENDFQKDFRSIRNMNVLEDYLKENIADIIDGDPIFLASFEEELRCRIRDDNERTADNYIRDRLTGDSVPVYFRGTFSLGAPVARAVLMKSGTSLYENLRTNLPSSTYYYNTGNNSAVETVFFYQLEKANLIYEQEDA